MNPWPFSGRSEAHPTHWLICAQVRVGTSQTLEFVEADDVAAYDGHHIASCAVRKSNHIAAIAWGLERRLPRRLYVDGAAFVRGYAALKARGLVFENRRFLQFTCRAASEAVASRRWRAPRLMVSRAGTERSRTP